MKKRVVFALTLLIASSTLRAQGPIEAKTSGMQKSPGFFTFYWDAREGKLWLEIDQFDQEFLYATSIAAGLGSYDVRLDRNQPSWTRVVKFERVGPKVLLVQSNYSFRADTPDLDVRKDVEDAFARAVLWGFDIAAEEGGKALVDASRFFLRDACGAVNLMNRGSQSPYSVDPARSVFFLPRTKSFPSNAEVEVELTLAGANPGSLVRQTAADPESVLLREHHSLVRLPDGAFRPRAFDPRADFQIVRYMDFAAPTDEPIVKRFILRHRLQK